MDKTLTIALQTYNRPKYLSESITSILNQSFEDYELIILDNGSEPDTVSVVKSFHDCRIRYIRNNINDLNFLNKAFEFVNNKFLMIFHDDDVMNPYLIENLIDTIEKDDTINTVSCSINLIDENSKSIKKTRPRIFKNKNWKKTEYIQEYLLRGNIIPCPATLYRSSIIKNNDLKYELEVGPAADLFLFFKINLLPGKMILLKKPLLNYRIHINQGSEQKRVELEIQVRQYIFKLLQENKLYTLSQKYLKASLGIILNILFNDVILGKLKYNNAINHLKKLKNERISLINIYTIYWSLIGVMRGLKNLLIR
jgi:glycosyltransferase involved in cell wall biosynthesis